MHHHSKTAIDIITHKEEQSNQLNLELLHHTFEFQSTLQKLILLEKISEWLCQQGHFSKYELVNEQSSFSYLETRWCTFGQVSYILKQLFRNWYFADCKHFTMRNILYKWESAAHLALSRCCHHTLYNTRKCFINSCVFWKFLSLKQNKRIMNKWHM